MKTKLSTCRRSFLLSVVSILGFMVFFAACQSNGNKKSDQTNFLVCPNQTYALCTSAPCVPHPTKPNITICQCDVIYDGVSLGLVLSSNFNCDDLKPYTKDGQTHLFSTYSTQQMTEGKAFMLCDASASWSNCLNMPCIINEDGKTATCYCEKIDNQPSTTLGGNCKPSTCQDSLWSAASTGSAQGATEYLNEWLVENGMDSLLVKTQFCDPSKN